MIDIVPKFYSVPYHPHPLLLPTGQGHGVVDLEILC